ncbi:hypothetical protein SISNIDRAFT_411239 [Sistotremastrum niveocremeum HHB9708]|uniref:Tetraspanin Tsp2 n=2 Tax=Sistotremastraceae TaxID=3402574 RepID=A0A164USG5_9AGAM|nr:hypothetical protein SISNIDRAFT_411239 [Sistotremastrum niveocremeum HHB9708]KZT43700.1 hypothetical protein SISSUDRAFT_1068641 [Sistotremastrum suecicum HHB10207 ss-3]
MAYTDPPLNPPNAPFRSQNRSPSLNSLSSSQKEYGAPTSLIVNYLPTKFTSPSGAYKRRKGEKGDSEVVPKQGGGREAFRTGESRMPGLDDDDYDSGRPGKRGKSRLRWNRFKWILFIANLLLSIYSLVALVFCLLTWFNIWDHADVVRVGNRPELILSTLAAAVGVVTSLIGWSGILLNNRSFLAVYTLSLWITFAFLVTPGYMTYKRKTFNLEGKINAQWSQELGVSGRLRVQNQLSCCGYFSPFVEATISQTCYSRSLLPGCKGVYLKFEKVVLQWWYIAAFGLVPVHLATMFAALLCSNHVTYRFGKGMMPKAYRLSMGSMAVIMDNYANQLAEQYGADVAAEVLNRSRSNLNLDAMPTMPYVSGERSPGGHGGYGSLSGGQIPTPDDYGHGKRF